jgi:hypothetical protein
MVFISPLISMSGFLILTLSFRFFCKYAKQIVSFVVLKPNRKLVVLSRQ